jgi:anti-anti-sigma regulatory factor
MRTQVNQGLSQRGIALLVIQGELDASNYLDILDKIRKLRHSGIRQIMLDLSQVRFISISGVVGLHWSLLLMNGYEVQEPEDGWSALHAVANECRALQKRISLVGLQPRVDNTLDMAGMKGYFEIYPSLETALDAYQTTEFVEDKS